MRTRRFLSRRWTSPFTATRRTGGRQTLHTPAFERLEDRMLLTAYVVDTLADTVAFDGKISLREAVDAASTNTAVREAPAGSLFGTVDTITFSSSLAGGTIQLSGTQLVLKERLSIVGLGADQLTINCNGGVRIFWGNAGSITSISGLTLTGATDNAIQNWGSMAVTGCVFTGNHGSTGGAINNLLGASLQLIDSVVEGNTAGYGGGIASVGATLEIVGCSISNNSAEGVGAGLGGGLYLHQNGTTDIINTTISGNSGRRGGGGVWQSDGWLTLRNSTVVGNWADFDGASESGGGISSTSWFWLYNTIVAGNVFSPAKTINDINGHVRTDIIDNRPRSSNNIIGDAGSAGALTNGVLNNIVGVDVASVLDPVLRDNGGLSKTHRLIYGSAAIDAGANSLAVDLDGAALAFDQRGASFARVIGGTVDIGAFETLPLSPPPPPLSSLTLTFAPVVTEADGVAASIGTVTRSGDLSQALTVFLSSSDATEATVPASVTIAAGAASATFSIDAVDDDLHDGTQAVVIRATVPATATGPVTADATFGTAGIATTSLSVDWLRPNAPMAVQADGKILVATEDAVSGSWRLIRLNQDGSLDATFGNGGEVVTAISGSMGAIPHKIVVQRDGKILVGGESNLGPAPGAVVARYNSNGTLDGTFANFVPGTPGILNLNGTAGWVADLAVRNDDKILLVIGGGSSFTVARLTDRGFQDGTFGSSGIRTYSNIATPASAIWVNADSSFLMAGGNKVARFDANGNLVSSAMFGTNGVATVDFAGSTVFNQQAVGISGLADGKFVIGYHIAVAGVDNSGNFAVARLNANGTLDTTFSGDGKATADFAGLDDIATSMTVQADGRILIAGSTEVGPSSENMAVVRFGLDGNLDATFDADGRFTQSRSSQERFLSIVARGQTLLAVGASGGNVDIYRYSLPDVAVTADRTLFVLDHETLTVTVTRTSFTEGETTSPATMTITRLNSDIDKALTVDAVSLNTREITLPANVVIAAGERSVTIPITVVDDLYVDGMIAFQIGAVATDYVGQGINVTVADNDAGPFGVGNVLVTAHETNGGPNQIREYTLSGTLVRIFEVAATADGNFRDIAVDSNGNAQVWEGVFSPLLKTLNPVTTAVASNPLLPGWSIANNVSFGGVATFNNYVFVTDMISGGAPTGIIRFDRSTGTSVRVSGNEFIDLTVGLDGLLYGLDSHDDVQVYDPVTLAHLRTIDITQTVFADFRTLTVNGDGELFVGASDGRIRKFDGATGTLLATSTVTFGFLVDIEVRGDGTIIAGNWSSSEFLVTNEALASVTRFTIPNIEGDAVFVSFAAPAPVFNLRPSADPATKTVAEDAVLNGTVTGSDPESTPLTFAVATGPSHGMLVLNPNGTFTYTPNANFNGSDSFTFRSSDGNLVSDPATVSITVTPAPDAPVFGLSTYNFSIAENSIVGTLAGTVGATDVDGDEVRYAIVSTSAPGAFMIDALTGAIAVADASTLDFETLASITLVIRATEQTAGMLTSDAAVTVSLTDVAAPQITGVRYGIVDSTRWVAATDLTGRTAAWEIDRIEITFDFDVDVSINSLSVFGTLGGNYTIGGFMYDATTHTAVWSLSASVLKDKLTLTLEGDGAAGVSHDGEFLDGGDVAMSLDVLFGDVDGSGTIDITDALLQRGYNGTTDIWSDLDGNGTVTIDDALLLRGQNGNRL